MYIEKINGPEDVKKLTVDEMTVMAGEMREALLKRASIHGGHFGPNFGMVEVYWSSFLVTLCSEIMLYIETPLVSYSYSLNEVSHSCTS